MAVPVEEAIAALSTFSLDNEQPELQGFAGAISVERGGTSSPIEFDDVSAYRLSLSEDIKALNQLNALLREGKEMVSVLYTYRGCVKALPQLSDSMKHTQADLYLETYRVLDLEMSRLREIQQWQASTASKLAADMQRFSRPERCINGPTVAHLWSMLKLIDILVQLDFLKNAKASIPNDFSWFKRTFTQVSIQWHEIDSMRDDLDDLQIFLSTRWAIISNLHVEMFRINNVEDILQVLIFFAVESLELDFGLLFPDKYVLLRVLPVIVVLAASSEKESEALYKRVKINRLVDIFKNDPVVPAFPDLHISSAAILKELLIHFKKFSSQSRLLTLAAPCEIPAREAQDHQRHYLIINHIELFRAEHDDFVIRFAASLSKLQLLKSSDSVDIEWRKRVKGNAYDCIVDGFQLLNRWTAFIWEQCAWKFSRPIKDPIDEPIGSFCDYEKVVRYNYSAEERSSLVELISCIKAVGSLMQRSETLVAEAMWETMHAEVQEFVQNTLATMLRATSKRDFMRILSDMRTISADWLANMNKPEGVSGSEDSRVIFYPRLVGPTTGQVLCLQFLICELVSGGNLRKSGGFFCNDDSEIPPNDVKLLEIFFYKLNFFLHMLDYSATLDSLTDLGFLWFREFYLESSRVIQFPIECSVPWMLVDHILDSQNSALLESVLMPFDIYNDAAQQALFSLRQRFLYDEIEAEADHCFDLFVFNLCEVIFGYYKGWAASDLLDPSFLFALEIGEKYSVQPMRFCALFKMTSVKLLGRMINLRHLIAERMNKLFRDNVEFLFDHFNSQDICAIVELEQLLKVLKHAHELLSEYLSLDSFSLIFNEIQENISLLSFSSRLASQIWSKMKSDFLPNFILCNATQRFVRLLRAPITSIPKSATPCGKTSFLCGSKELNSAYQSLACLYGGFFGIPHLLSIVKLLGSRSLPWLIRSLLDHILDKLTNLESLIAELQEMLPKVIPLLPFDQGFVGSLMLMKEILSYDTKLELKVDVLKEIKEIGSVVYWIGLLDIVMREVDTMNFIQLAPWLGLIPGADGQILRSEASEGCPVVELLKSATAALESNPGFTSSPSFGVLSKHAEAADLLYKANMNTGSVLEYALAYANVSLDKYRSKWAPPKTGLSDVASKGFYCIYSFLQTGYLLEYAQGALSSTEILGDSVAWGGCTIIYLLGQQLQLELFDLSYQILNVAEMESVSMSQNSKNSHVYQGWDVLVEAMKRARRLNNHVFSMLKASCPQEDKVACFVMQDGSLVHDIKFSNAVSAFEALPQKLPKM